MARTVKCEGHYGDEGPCGVEFVEGRDDGSNVTIDELLACHQDACDEDCYWMIYKRHTGLGIIDVSRRTDKMPSDAALLSGTHYDSEEEAEAMITGINDWLLGGKGSARPAEIMINALKPMTDAQREKIFDALKSEFCIHCGKPTPHFPVGGCSCTNDE